MLHLLSAARNKNFEVAIALRLDSEKKQTKNNNITESR